MITRFSRASVFVFAFAFAAVTVQGSDVFTETFESPRTVGSLSGQNGWTADSGISVENTIKHAGSQGCELGITSPDTPVSMSQTITAVGENTIWADFYTKPVLGQAAAIANANAVAVFYFNLLGQVVAYNNATAVTIDNEDLPTVSTNSWNRITVRIDYAAKKWDLWLNGTNVVSQFTFYMNNDQTTLANMTVTEGSGNVVGTKSYVDDINVKTTYAYDPVVLNSRATVTTSGSLQITFNGILSLGTANCTIYWGRTDGGTTPGAWANSISLGSKAMGPFDSGPVSSGTGLDSSSLSTDTIYYYRCLAGTQWSEQTYVVMAQRRSNSGWHLASLPASYGPAGGTNSYMTGKLGAFLAGGLAASGNSLTGDRFYIQDNDAGTTTWAQGFFWNGVTPNTWKDDPPASPPLLSSLEIQPGMGFWINRKVAGADPTYCGLSGPKLLSLPIPINFPANTWKVFGWAGTESIQDVTGWGFANSPNATAGSSIENSDLIFGQDTAGTWTLLYLSDDGGSGKRWHKHGTVSTPNTTFKMMPGRGYYYYHNGGSTLAWNPTLP